MEVLLCLWKVAVQPVLEELGFQSIIANCLVYGGLVLARFLNHYCTRRVTILLAQLQTLLYSQYQDTLLRSVEMNGPRHQSQPATVDYAGHSRSRTYVTWLGV